MTTGVIVSVLIVLILLWLGFNEAEKDYMACICGRQPKRLDAVYPGDGVIYRCSYCTLCGVPARKDIDAKTNWHRLIVYHKSVKRNKQVDF